MKRLRIWQQNVNKSLDAQLDLLQALGAKNFEIAAIQEPHIDFLNLTRANPHWIVVYPSGHHDRDELTRAVLPISTRISTNT